MLFKIFCLVFEISYNFSILSWDFCTYSVKCNVKNNITSTDGIRSSLNHPNLAKCARGRRPYDIGCVREGLQTDFMCRICQGYSDLIIHRVRSLKPPQLADKSFMNFEKVRVCWANCLYGYRGNYKQVRSNSSANNFWLKNSWMMKFTCNGGPIAQVTCTLLCEDERRSKWQFIYQIDSLLKWGSSLDGSSTTESNSSKPAKLERVPKTEKRTVRNQWSIVKTPHSSLWREVMMCVEESVVA